MIRSGTKWLPSPLALLRGRKKLELSQIMCNEVTSCHSHSTSVLTHRRFQLSPMPKSSSQMSLSHSSPFCFTLPQSFHLTTPALNFLKSPRPLVPLFSFSPSGPILVLLLFFSQPGSLVYKTCQLSLVMPCPLCLLVIHGWQNGTCEFIDSQAHVAEHSWRKSLRSFNQSHQESHVAMPNLHLCFPCLSLTNSCLTAEGPASEESQPLNVLPQINAQRKILRPDLSLTPPALL